MYFESHTHLLSTVGTFHHHRARHLHLPLVGAPQLHHQKRLQHSLEPLPELHHGRASLHPPGQRRLGQAQCRAVWPVPSQLPSQHVGQPGCCSCRLDRWGSGSTVLQCSRQQPLFLPQAGLWRSPVCCQSVAILRSQSQAAGAPSVHHSLGRGTCAGCMWAELALHLQMQQMAARPVDDLCHDCCHTHQAAVPWEKKTARCAVPAVSSVCRQFAHATEGRLANQSSQSVWAAHVTEGRHMLQEWPAPQPSLPTTWQGC